MQEMQISEINEKKNVREDLGDLTELTNSVKIHGILEPLIVDKDKNLIAGHRRLQAAKNAGLKKVPVVEIEGYNTESGRMEAQLIENIQRKDLTPFEEGTAYKKYMAVKKVDEEFLGKTIGKKTDYIKRRVKLLKATEPVIEALNKGQIEIGHAEILAQMTKEQQEKSLKTITTFDLTVQNFSDNIRWMQKIDFGDIKFRTSDGDSQKTLLSAIGQELDPLNEVDSNLMTDEAFKADIAKYVESQRKTLEEKGIKVFKSKEELEKKYPGAYEIQSWDAIEYKKAVKNLTKSKELVVVVDFNGYSIITEVYNTTPRKEEEPTAGESETQEDVDVEKALELSREQKLTYRISDYKRNMLLRTTNERIKPGDNNAKIMTLWALLQPQRAGWSMEPEAVELLKEMGVKRPSEYAAFTEIIKPLSKLSDTELKYYTRKAAMIKLNQLSNDELSIMSKLTGFVLDMDWKIDKEFLEIHTKDQLAKLVKELKLKTPSKADIDGLKKSEMVEEILKNDLKGLVPKRMG